MYKDILSSIDHIEVYPIISFLIFFCFFTFLLFIVWRSDKSLMARLSALPLEVEENKSQDDNHHAEKTSL